MLTLFFVACLVSAVWLVSKYTEKEEYFFERLNEADPNCWEGSENAISHHLKVMRFFYQNAYLDLNDPEINELAQELKRLSRIATSLVVVGVGVGGYVLFSFWGGS